MEKPKGAKMLVITRKPHEEIVVYCKNPETGVQEKINIIVKEVKGKQVRIAFQAAKSSVEIYRAETLTKHDSDSKQLELL